MWTNIHSRSQEPNPPAATTLSLSGYGAICGAWESLGCGRHCCAARSNSEFPWSTVVVWHWPRPTDPLNFPMSDSRPSRWSRPPGWLRRPVWRLKLRWESDTTISCQRHPSLSRSCSPARQYRCYVINVCAIETRFHYLRRPQPLHVCACLCASPSPSPSTAPVQGLLDPVFATCFTSRQDHILCVIRNLARTISDVCSRLVYFQSTSTSSTLEVLHSMCYRVEYTYGTPTKFPELFRLHQVSPELPLRPLDGSRVFFSAYFACQPLVTAYSVNTSLLYKFTTYLLTYYDSSHVPHNKCTHKRYTEEKSCQTWHLLKWTRLSVGCRYKCDSWPVTQWLGVMIYNLFYDHTMTCPYKATGTSLFDDSDRM